MSDFHLGKNSRMLLAGVHNDLAGVVQGAIEISGIDFKVLCGLRSASDQAALVASGASRTLNSKHIRQVDGWGHAVDLVPIINGAISWRWEHFYPIASAMSHAARDLSVAVTWGGCWDRLLNELRADELENEIDAYKARFHANPKNHGKPAFLDGPHFQI